MKSFTTQRFLTIYSGGLTLILAVIVFAGFANTRSQTFDEITVRRINVVEPDGTLRMVISDHAKFPGIIIRGKEQPFQRPQAGMLFYNDEASENGGLIFGGRKSANNEVTDSGGSLSFDKYDANQIVQLAGVDDKDDRFSGLIVWDSEKGAAGRRRVWLGRGEDGAATLNLMDAKGKKRVVVEVTADGRPSLSFLDEDGKVISRLPATR